MMTRTSCWPWTRRPKNSIYQYKLSDGTISKKMDVPGLLTGLFKLN
ncbi:MAG: hypothetical protein WKG07_03745 [Hymenobacter sp.]